MTANKDSATIVGLGAAACAVCCAGPILAILAAIGLGTAAGAAAFGVIAVAIGGAVATSVIVRRRRRVAACSTATNLPTQVALTSRSHRDTHPSADCVLVQRLAALNLPAQVKLTSRSPDDTAPVR